MNFRKMLQVLFFIALFSCEEALERQLDESKVVLIGPAKQVATDSPVDFGWEALAGATAYRLTIVSPSFDSVGLFVADSVVSKTFLSLPLDSGTYSWKVQAFNGSSTSISSDPETFKVQ